MGTTSRGLPYPEPTDPASQGAAAIQSLAEAVQTMTQYGSGTVTVSNNNTWYSEDVYFTEPFAGTPRVAITPRGSGSNSMEVRVEARSATYFTAGGKRPSGSGTGSVQFDWIAVGPLTGATVLSDDERITRND